MEPKAHAPFLIESFPKTSRTWTERSQFSASHNYKTKQTTFISRLVWHVPLVQVWTHYKIGKLNVWPLFYNVCNNFLNSQIWNEIMLELNGKPSSVTTSSTDFPSKIWFLRIYLNFQWQKSLKNQYFPHSESKSYQINYIKSCSSRSF